MYNDKDKKYSGMDPADKYRIRMTMREVRKEIRDKRRAQRPPNSYLFWGLMLILWGILIALLKQDLISPDDMWKAFLIGLGVIFLIQAIVYYVNPSTRHIALGRVTPAVILILVGMGFLFGLSSWWPVTMMVAGVAGIFTSWFLQREIQKRRVTQETLRES